MIEQRTVVADGNGHEKRGIFRALLVMKDEAGGQVVSPEKSLLNLICSIHGCRPFPSIVEDGQRSDQNAGAIGL